MIVIENGKVYQVAELSKLAQEVQGKKYGLTEAASEIAVRVINRMLKNKKNEK